MSATRYPVLFTHSGKTDTALLDYKLQRSDGGMKLKISASEEIGPVAMRFGPFETQPEISKVHINGKSPANAVTEHSGDSWWVKFTADIGPKK
jgi:hypothetical protein